VIAFAAGKPVDRFVGVQPEGVIRAFIDRLAPDPGPVLMTQVRGLLSAGQTEQAARELRDALAINPARDDLRALYVRTLLRLQKVDEAAIAFAPMLPNAHTELRAAALRMLIDAHRVARDHPELQPLREAVERAPREPAPRWRLAQCLMARDDWPQAMDELLELIRCDRRFGGDAGRRGMLAAFELCDDAQRVREYRRRLAALGR
jgi:putative thioredoxin